MVALTLPRLLPETRDRCPYPRQSVAETDKSEAREADPAARCRTFTRGAENRGEQERASERDKKPAFPEIFPSYLSRLRFGIHLARISHST